MDVNDVTEIIIGSAIDVHKVLGPGLLESAYEECLCYELNLQGIEVRRQVSLPVIYKEVSLDAGYRLDLMVENKVIVELKTVDKLMPIHDAQLLTYMKLINCSVGLLINFNVPVLKQGIRRKVLNYVG
ncbi:MAG: GxxExxY protein [Gammaproteobacteria bacterium]|nr:GxxExxY protein [Gammaproteobacteria bacterium]